MSMYACNSAGTETAICTFRLARGLSGSPFPVLSQGDERLHDEVPPASRYNAGMKYSLRSLP
jgi:hypothetical protein